MSPRRLQGWEPQEVTSFEYDEQGRLIRAVTAREAEFSQSDVSDLLASRLHEASVLSHGYTLDEVTSRLADPMNPDGQYYFKASRMPSTDFAAQALAGAQEAYYKQYPDVNRDSHVWRVEKVMRDKPQSQ